MKKKKKEESMEHTCPNCGYCRHCGKGGGGNQWPYYPGWYPYTAPSVSWTTGGTVIAGGASKESTITFGGNITNA